MSLGQQPAGFGVNPPPGGYGTPTQAPGGYNAQPSPQPPPAVGGYKQPQFGGSDHTVTLTYPDLKLDIYPFLTPMEMVNIASTFMAFDLDKSGYVVKDEMYNALLSNGISADPVTVQNQINKMDTNRDGAVSWTEYFVFMVEMFKNKGQR
ncbi:hypothetical protein ACOME3_000916 [Neoechinorhynchus agilis]